jgi:uncharacterized membrane protein YdjX (TVP38/TMEM64 family)
VADHGPVVVGLSRLLPVIPFNMQNYAFGLTGVRFWTYMFWSWLCMLPGAVFTVTAGDTVARTLASGQVPWALIAVVGSTAVAIVALAAYAVLRLWALGKASKAREQSQSTGDERE